MTTFGESCIIGMLLGEFKGILLCIFAVEAYTASWIEIWCAATVSAAAIGRGLYSLVDCNSGGKDSLCMAQSRGLYSLVD